MTLARELGEHFSLTKSSDLPADRIHEMKRLLVDYLGVALAGSQVDTGRLAGDFVVEMGGAAQASLIGRTERVPAVHAAFANAISEHSIELDDVDDEALFHYGPPVYSAALAVAQSTGASGSETLAAALSGCEMMNRLSRAVNPSLRDRGFHTTPTCGVFGAAVAAGRLLHLTPDQMTSALGLAGAQASGLMEMYGISMQKRINPGPAARNGVTAAILAARGFTGADTIIDGPRGFAAAFADEFDPTQLTAGLGSDVPVIVEYKPYSAARPIHNAIDCALELRRLHGVSLSDIEKVVVYRHPTWADYHVINRPRTYHEAQVSLPYSVAIAFAEGSALPEQYVDSKLSDAAIMGVSDSVRIERDASLKRGVSCRMVVTTRSGSELVAEVDYPRGSAQNPMSDADLLDKFRMLSAAVLAPEKAEQLAQRALAAELENDINDLIDLTH
jgi:2-methylcitrate dehydratase PrpD